MCLRTNSPRRFAALMERTRTISGGKSLAMPKRWQSASFKTFHDDDLNIGAVLKRDDFTEAAMMS
jgi:hypothetical protein